MIGLRLTLTALGRDPYDLVVIAWHDHYAWIRNGGRPYPMAIGTLVLEARAARAVCVEPITLTAAEAAEIAFGTPFLNRGDAGGIWCAHLNDALDAAERAGCFDPVQTTRIKSVREIEGYVKTVELDDGRYASRFVEDEA